MSVSIITEETIREQTENYVERVEYTYTIVIEEGGRYIGINPNGEYKIFEKGEVRTVQNETGCIGRPEQTSNSPLNGTNDPIEIDLSNIKKPVRSVISVFMTEYTIIHGNVGEVRVN